MKKSFFLEGYGCSLNVSETEQIAGVLNSAGFRRSKSFSSSDFVIINTCAVKSVTEQRMLSRIQFLFEHKKQKSKLIVSGCLGETRKEIISKISPEINILGTNLADLCVSVGIPTKKFSPEIEGDRSIELVSIIPISTGCLGSCTYCSAKLARGDLSSYSFEQISSAFRRAIKSSKEIWITSQDLGCYGKDIGSSLPSLLKELLKNKGSFRIRLGMMNPNHFMEIKEQLVPLFADERLYKFLHLPVQSGSNSVLAAMERKYSVKDFEECISFARKNIPDVSISTDVIVGFAGETESDFQKTILLLKKIKPEFVNLSRFGKRPGTKAVKMSGQLSEEEKKRRSRIIDSLCGELFLEKNHALVGKEFNALVSERAKKGYFCARTDSYKVIMVKKGFGEFVRVRAVSAHKHSLKGEVLRVLN